MPYLRNTDGEWPATTEYRDASRKDRRRRSFDPQLSGAGFVQFEYDDGNGLWIKAEETPSDQA